MHNALKSTVSPQFGETKKQFVYLDDIFATAKRER